jgi:hypothetical protein
VIHARLRADVLYVTREQWPQNSPNSGLQGLRFSHLSLCSAVISVVSDLRFPLTLEQGRGKVLLVFERQRTSRNPVLQVT